MVEEEYDPNTFWVNPLPYQGTVRSILDSGVSSSGSTTLADISAEERPVAANVFSQAMGFCSTRYRNDPWFLGQHPRQGYLGSSGFFSVGKMLQ